MKMFKTKRNNGKDFYVAIDDDGKVILPIHSYLRHLAIKNNSKNTIRKNCTALLTFWQYLKDNGFDYLEFAGKKSGINKGFYENLMDYKLYLLYPASKDNVVPIDGIKQVRKDSTVNQMLSCVICFYRFLSDTGIVGDLPMVQQMQSLQHTHSILNGMFLKKKNAVKSLYSSKVDEEELRYVTEEEFDRCWDACTSRRNRVIIGLMFYGGLRVSEVVGLKLEDLRDIHRNVIYIRLRNDPGNPDAAVKYGSIGSVVIDDRLRDEIIDYMNEDLKGIDTDYLIVNLKAGHSGTPMKTDTVREMVRNLGKKVNIKGLHPHAFRHGCAMRMLNNDCDMMKISVKLRHKHMQTTANIYAKYDLSAKMKIQEELSKKLGKEFAPLEIDFDGLTEYLTGGEEDEQKTD